jgi:hypothetical protein
LFWRKDNNPKKCAGFEFWRVWFLYIYWKLIAVGDCLKTGGLHVMKQEEERNRVRRLTARAKKKPAVFILTIVQLPSDHPFERLQFPAELFRRGNQQI